MSDPFDNDGRRAEGATPSEIHVEVSPEASSDEREAILAAVRATLEREATLARPAAWRLSGWIGQRVGITDLARWVPASRVWPRSAQMPWGGRTFPGLIGRGDAK